MKKFLNLYNFNTNLNIVIIIKLINTIDNYLNNIITDRKILID